MPLFQSTSHPEEVTTLLRLFDDYQDQVNRRTARHHQPAVRSFTPRFDFREGDDAYYVDGELPGTSEKDIDIEFSDAQTLVVKGHTERNYDSEPEGQLGATEGQTSAAKTDKTKANHRFWVSERSVGEFQRTFSFPVRVDPDAVKASLKNGILSIFIPKAPASVTKKIIIE